MLVRMFDETDEEIERESNDMDWEEEKGQGGGKVVGIGLVGLRTDQT